MNMHMLMHKKILSTWSMTMAETKEYITRIARNARFRRIGSLGRKK